MKLKIANIQVLSFTFVSSTYDFFSIKNFFCRIFSSVLKSNGVTSNKTKISPEKMHKKTKIMIDDSKFLIELKIRASCWKFKNPSSQFFKKPKKKKGTKLLEIFKTFSIRIWKIPILISNTEQNFGRILHDDKFSPSRIGPLRQKLKEWRSNEDFLFYSNRHFSEPQTFNFFLLILKKRKVSCLFIMRLWIIINYINEVFLYK